MPGMLEVRESPPSRLVFGHSPGAWFLTRLFCRVSLALAFAAAIARAQSVEGSIKDRGSDLPVPGMVIFLLDSAGTPVA